MEYDPSTGTATLFLDGDTVFTGSFAGWIDAVHVLDDGSIVFSVFSGATIGELDFDSNDLVRYYPDTQRAEVILDLETIITGGSFLRDVDALHISNGNIVFSTRAELTIGDLSFEDEDLVEYSPSTGSVTLFFNGSDVFPPTDLDVADIDAFSLVDEGGGGDPPPPPPPCTGGAITNPINIAIGQQLSCELTGADPGFTSGKHFKAFQLSSPGGQLTFNATASAFTPRFGRRDPSGDDSFFTYPLPYSASDITAGTFLFLISSTDPDRFGSFSVVVTNPVNNSANAGKSTRSEAPIRLPEDFEPKGFEYEMLQ